MCLLLAAAAPARYERQPGETFGAPINGMSIKLPHGGDPGEVPEAYREWVMPTVSVRFVRRGKYALQCNNRCCRCRISWRAIFAVMWILTVLAIIGFTAYSAFNDNAPIRKRVANFAWRIATIVAPMALQQAAFGNRRPS